uniref:Uncharacterized protein n=1 Tax=Odontella aurita TaxID=265563 RepID=A0A6U6KXQ4_9STRA|mmetsp:Transcript_63022/g.186163  ORF Transcript_63022/g.186163 Transcript_63022/m.186163 type:complete len:117 (+) Transcript_63022:112-462(+)
MEFGTSSIAASVAKKQANGLLAGIKNGMRGGSQVNNEKQRELRHSRTQRDAEFEQKKRDRAAKKNELAQKWSAATNRPVGTLTSVRPRVSKPLAEMSLCERFCDGWYRLEEELDHG